ncbi:MAG: UMP kinase [Methanomassiliicoccales archaeon]|nr:MAG: UMP kinase [Methanomassiliicoccales archaeon]
MDTVVISLGGSILIPGDDDHIFLRKVADLIRDLCEERRIFIVCGGGKIARYYISTARELGRPVDELDELGIGVTRLNARLLQMALGDVAVNCMPTTPEEAVSASVEGKVVVMGGTCPGHTTDAVSAMVAEAAGADRIVNGTSVDAAYTADPKKHPDARRISRMTFKALYELVNKGAHGAGPSDVFDRLGAEIAMRNKIPIYIINGRDIDELRKAVLGQEVKGTYIGD